MYNDDFTFEEWPTNFSNPYLNSDHSVINYTHLHYYITVIMDLNEVTPQYPPAHHPVITPKSERLSAVKSVKPSGVCTYNYVCMNMFRLIKSKEYIT